MTLRSLRDHLGIIWEDFGCMRVALGDFLIIFDVVNDVDVHGWWSGGAENRKC